MHVSHECMYVKRGPHLGPGTMQFGMADSAAAFQTPTWDSPHSNVQFCHLPLFASCLASRMFCLCPHRLFNKCFTFYEVPCELDSNQSVQ